MTRLFIIRHGRPKETWGGADPDPGLDPVGIRQAVEAAVALLSLPAPQRPIKVASSPLRRCLETATPLAQALGVDLEIVPLVGEIPTPAGLAISERGPWLRRALAGDWSQIDGDLDYDAWRRGVWEAARARPATAIFSHFVAINALISVIENRDQVIGFRPDHASITTLEAEGPDLGLVELGREALTGVL
ncbi:MAG TPA: histidine phosphatase family protein [Caulobacteraceae bacterium]|jgi:broad specificity phosphatase PhoE